MGFVIYFLLLASLILFSNWWRKEIVWVWPQIDICGFWGYNITHYASADPWGLWYFVNFLLCKELPLLIPLIFMIILWVITLKIIPFSFLDNVIHKCLSSMIFFNFAQNYTLSLIRLLNQDVVNLCFDNNKIRFTNNYLS